MATETKKIKVIRMPAMDVKTGEWLGEKVRPEEEKKTLLNDRDIEPDIENLISMADLAGRSFVMKPESLANIWRKAGGEMANMRANTILKKGDLSKHKGELLRFKFDSEGDIEDVVDPESGKSILASSQKAPEVEEEEVEVTGGDEGKAGGGAVGSELPAKTPRQMKKLKIRRRDYSPGMSKDASLPAGVKEGGTVAMGDHKDVGSMSEQKKIKIKGPEREMFHGGPVEGDYEGGEFPTKLPSQENPTAKPYQCVMGNKSEDAPEQKGNSSEMVASLSKGGEVKKGSYAKGGTVSGRQMTGAQIEREFGIKKPGDAATVYDVDVQEGKLVNAVMNDSETKRFSKIISETVDKNPPVGDADERNKMALQYENKPNVGFASGAGFAEGGEVPAGSHEMPDGSIMKDSEMEAAPEGAATETEPAPEVAESEAEADMTGPFEAYAKVSGIDKALVKQGNDLFKSLDSAVSAEKPEEAQTYLDQLKQYVRDVEDKRTEAVKKMNDTSLAASYKEMASEAKDLLSAFENMIADIGSEEMKAARPSEMSVA